MTDNKIMKVQLTDVSYPGLPGDNSGDLIGFVLFLLWPVWAVWFCVCVLIPCGIALALISISKIAALLVAACLGVPLGLFVFVLPIYGVYKWMKSKEAKIPQTSPTSRAIPLAK